MKYFDVTVKFETTGGNSFGETETLVMERTHTVQAVDVESAEMGARLEAEQQGKKVVGVSACALAEGEFERRQ